MTQSALLYLPGATEGTTQWRAETVQVVNWGGFHGHTQVGLAFGSTLLSGASATGKSTLLDAYLALMMPADTPFNNASNDATTGRARGADQRNLLTYLRGKRNTNRESGTDELTDQVLRGADGATWGAVAATFVDDHQRRFTALRVYFVPRGAGRVGEIVMKMASLDGRIDLAQLAALAPGRFDKRALQGRWPTMTVHGSYAEFSQTLFTRLGIGAGGDGLRALRLLARIQAGHQVHTVDGLYKSLVLERPATYTAADNAIKHFTDLDATYQAMLTEEHKVEVLARLPRLHDDLEQARADEHLLSTLGLGRPGDSPFLLWALRTEQRLHDTAIEANRGDHQRVETEHAAAAARVTDLEGRLEEVRELKSAHGGDVLEQLRQELERLQRRRTDVAARRDLFDTRTACLPAAPGTVEEFTDARAAAEAFLAGVDAHRTELEQQRNAIARDGVPLMGRRDDLDGEYRSLQGRAGLVPRRLHEARLTIADAAGIDPDELPFVAELIDLAPAEQDWRPAAEAVLYSLVRVMLVDQQLLDDLSAAIDPLRLRTRIQFEGVALTPFRSRPADPAFLSGKLQYRDSPFSGWVQERLRRRSTDARCVDTVDQLGGGPRGGDELRVLRSGQTRHGRRGAHGDQGADPIIGFSNTARLAAITEEIERINAELGALARADRELVDELNRLRNLGNAHQHLVDTRWDEVDLAAVDTLIAESRRQHDHLLHSSDMLQELQRQEGQLDGDLGKAREAEFGARRDLDDLDTAHHRLTRRRHAIGADLERVGHDDQVHLTDAQTQRIDTVFVTVGESGDLAAFGGNLRRLRDRLGAQHREATRRAADATEAQCAIFRTYQSRWSDPNLGVEIASAAGYRAILDHITATGLHERRREWRRRLSDWSGQDLVPLNGAFETAIEDIEERLRPVNEILAALPFGPGGDRLRITLRRLQYDDLTTFRRELKALSSGVTDDLAEEKMQARFERLRLFIAQISPPRKTDPAGHGDHGDPGDHRARDRATPSRRDFLLDVRQHVQITAVQLGPDDVEVAVHAALGGKSGGESQELIAFIVGAALRFQLGDEDRARPRFAPVILDEGFIKADSQYAGRAVAAWQGLGFQLIVAAPLDKVTALEPYMDLLLTTTKSAQGYSHLTELPRTDRAPARAGAGPGGADGADSAAADSAAEGAA